MISGSPPHARGRLDVSKGEIDYERITPACAGKTPHTVAVSVDRVDHPRMRGEDVLGKFALSLMPRITPACAGKTHVSTGTFALIWDHPRMRGEDFICGHMPMSWSGSPPHARGRRLDRRRVPARPGITPACAGKTSNGKGYHDFL